MLLISFAEKIAFSLLLYSRDLVVMRSIIAFIRVLGVFAVLIGGIGALVLTSPMASRHTSHKIYMSFKGILLWVVGINCLLYTSPSPRDATLSRMPSSA